MYADRLFNALERNEVVPGQLLIAAPGMADHNPHCVRSAIFVVEHSAQGTFGVDLTRRSDFAVHNYLPEWVPLTAKPQAIYFGGPDNPESVLALAHTKTGVDIDAHPGLAKLAPRLAMVDMRLGPDALADVIEGLRLFSGCFTWAPGQLDDQIEAGDWYVASALPQDLLAPGPADVWGDAMRRQPMPLPFYATAPAALTGITPYERFLMD